MTICIDDSLIIDITNTVNKRYNCNYSPKDIERITIYKTFMLVIINNSSYHINY